MTRALSIAEAARDFDAVVRSVERGEEIVLTRDGQTIARLVPAPPAAAKRTEAVQAAARLIERSRDTRLEGLSIRQLVRSEERGEEIVLDGSAVFREAAAVGASEGTGKAAALARTRARLESGLDLDVPRLDRDGLHEH